MRRAFAGLVLAVSPLACGCLAFARGQAGAAMSASDTPGHSGPVVGADGVFALRGLGSVGTESQPFLSASITRSKRCSRRSEKISLGVPGSRSSVRRVPCQVT